MKILFSPTRNENERIIYNFQEDIVIVRYKNVIDTFDFTDFGNGKLQLHDEETGEELIETTLPENPIRSAERKDGVLYVELMNYIGLHASYEERFPEWIDHEDYVAPEEEEVESDGEDGLEE